MSYLRHEEIMRNVRDCYECGHFNILDNNRKDV